MQQLLGMAREKHTKVKESELNKMVRVDIAQFVIDQGMVLITDPRCDKYFHNKLHECHHTDSDLKNMSPEDSKT